MRIATDLSRRQVAAWFAAGAVLAAAPASAVSSEELPLADRLAAYAHALRFADLDPATVETVKVRLIDARGCGLAALDAGRCGSVGGSRSAMGRVPRQFPARTGGAARNSRPSPTASPSATRISTTSMDGREIVRQVDDVPGFVSRPMTRDDVERKFHMNADERLNARKVRRVHDTFWTIDERFDLTGLLASLS